MESDEDMYLEGATDFCRLRAQEFAALLMRLIDLLESEAATREVALAFGGYDDVLTRLDALEAALQAPRGAESEALARIERDISLMRQTLCE